MTAADVRVLRRTANARELYLLPDAELSRASRARISLWSGCTASGCAAPRPGDPRSRQRTPAKGAAAAGPRIEAETPS